MTVKLWWVGVISLGASAWAQDPVGTQIEAQSEWAAEENDAAAAFAPVAIRDPFEGFNRAVFRFNDGLFTYGVRPLARGYEAVTPAPMRRGIGNFFANLGYPGRFVNSLLQGKLDRAGRETGKFLVNTVAGLGGFIRVSDDVAGLEVVPGEDTGQTLGAWGVGRGSYLVLPVLGPSTMRDLVGTVGDFGLQPLNWGVLENSSTYDWRWTAVPQTLERVNGLPAAIVGYDAATAGAVDPYAALRTGYVQYREMLVRE